MLLLFTDTDPLAYEIKTDDFYSDKILASMLKVDLI